MVKMLSNIMAKSPWIVHVNCNSCNGCDIELLACLTPLYDAERFGVINIGTPKQADILVVTGSVNHKNINVLKNIYSQMPSPKAVVAVGACASTGGIFHSCYNVIGGADEVIPVDVYVPGCCPKPESILDGIVQAAGILEKKRLGRDREAEE
jgi:ech hydrogenase subunit C